MPQRLLLLADLCEFVGGGRNEVMVKDCRKIVLQKSLVFASWEVKTIRTQ